MICLDLSKIEKIQRGNKGTLIARCPACALDGRDKSGNHLIIYPSGKYGCAIHKEDKDHTNLIYQLVGNGSDGTIKETTAKKEPEIEEPEILYPISKLQDLVQNHDYWIKRGISETTIRKFRGGLAMTDKGKLAGRYVFPIFMPDGQNIHGWTGRTLKSSEDVEKYGIKKYKHIGPTSKFVYPLFLNHSIITEWGWIILTEGHGDILSLFDNDMPNSLELFGTNISASLIAALISANVKKIIIATNNEPDNDNIGNEAAEKIQYKLLPFFDKHVVHIKLPYKKDFGDMSRDEIKQWREEALKL